MRLLSYNIWLGGKGREDAIASVIRSCDPDVVLLQEAYEPAVVEHLSAACNLPYRGAMRGHSTAYLSRLEIAHHAWHEVRFARRRYLELVLAGSRLRLYGVHLSAVHSNITERRRWWELRELLRGIEEHQKGPHLVAGDFNTLAPGEKLDVGRLPFRLRWFVYLTGRQIRFITLQQMADAGYIDAFRTLHPDDVGFTFPVSDPHVRLDYVFLPGHMRARLRTCRVVQEAGPASDHMPLLAEISEKG
ncbi:MAG TPA: endonuclease/exonuclease/phosphatase family protein [Bryobacteraceae bacterium]|nr:endonuclease/exonuclease/phosphatase family protein [Bryobacteraceae bacterium]